jgi:two-component system, cell cycle sensor histidine kinase PleC
MSALLNVDETALPPSPRETLDLRLLEAATRYLFVNSLPLPLVICGLAGILSAWSPIMPVAIWAGVTLAMWTLFGVSLYRFQHDPARAKKLRAWTATIGTLLFLAASSLASVSLLFWVDNDRLNNVMLYVFVAAAMATGAGQSAPSRWLSVANLSPYCVVFMSVSLIHEHFPYNLAFAGLEIVYFGLVVMFTQAVRQLAREMLSLRDEKRALVVRQQSSLTDATAARQRAETASRAKSLFLANMSHELRTPLNAVLGFSEVIRDRLFGDNALPRYSEYAGNIHASGTHLLGLINDVLDLSKIEAGKLELAPERYDLVADASEALRFVEPQAARKNVQLVREMPSELEIVADKRALRQIAVNLLSNAVKFTPPGGTVTLSLSWRGDASISLSVTDTGIGIRPEDMERVLETFGQGRHDISPADEQGTGLGLAIAKSLTEAHGGTIAIASELGEGTTVTVTLPQGQGVQALGGTRAA